MEKLNLSNSHRAVNLQAIRVNKMTLSSIYCQRYDSDRNCLDTLCNHLVFSHLAIKEMLSFLIFLLFNSLTVPLRCCLENTMFKCWQLDGENVAFNK